MQEGSPSTCHSLVWAGNLRGPSPGRRCRSEAVPKLERNLTKSRQRAKPLGDEPTVPKPHVHMGFPREGMKDFPPSPSQIIPTFYSWIYHANLAYTCIVASD